MFLLCAVKVPDTVTEMMMAELHHQEACQRINSTLKFYTLWRFRYEVWPRMEEGAQQIFKVQFRRHSGRKADFRSRLALLMRICRLFQIPPPSINFTLPSPILGMPCVPIFDPPWVPQNTGSVQDPINEDQSVSPSFLFSCTYRNHRINISLHVFGTCDSETNGSHIEANILRTEYLILLYHHN